MVIGTGTLVVFQVAASEVAQAAQEPVATGVISPENANALGYKPNNPGDVPIGKPFLLGTVRHNNFQVHSASQWVHSSIDVNIVGIEDSFPFDQEETEDDTDTTVALSDEGAYMLSLRANGPNFCPANATYAALNRDVGSGVWYCYRHVGKGRGNREIYTNNPAAYPDVAGTPDQSPNSEDVLTISRTTSNKTVMTDGILYRLVIAGFIPSGDGVCPDTLPAGITPVPTFSSKENKTSYGCLYATFSQECYIRIAKTVTPESEATGGKIPSFNFTTLGIGDFVSPTGEPLDTAENAGGFVDWSSFADSPLTPSGYGKDGTVTSGYQAFIPGYSQFVIAETGPCTPRAPPPVLWRTRLLRALEGLRRPELGPLGAHQHQLRQRHRRGRQRHARPHDRRHRLLRRAPGQDRGRRAAHLQLHDPAAGPQASH